VHTSLLANWVYGSSRLSSAVAEAVAALTDGAASPAGGGGHTQPAPYPAGYPAPLVQGPLSNARANLLGVCGVRGVCGVCAMCGGGGVTPRVEVARAL
jgi:hypothetical protein